MIENRISEVPDTICQSTVHGINPIVPAECNTSDFRSVSLEVV